MKKYTSDEIKELKKSAKFGFRVFMLLIFLIIFFDSAFDSTSILKDKIIGFFINFSLFLFCFFIGEKFQDHCLEKKFTKLLKNN